ncbi:MAG: proprotein convertase P-domain-containing protein [Phycisphaerales bacterium]|nr:proprotein convertase P-domain-containing protein [Phycisphaerales bacterium]
MKSHRYVLALAFSMFASSTLMAQMNPAEPGSDLFKTQLSRIKAGYTDRPTAELLSVDPLNRVDVTYADLDDIDVLIAEDEIREREGLPPRYAVPQATLIAPDTHGTWEQLDADTQLWRLRIESPKAVSINLGFTRYNLPDSARLSVYSADLKHIIRPFTSKDNQPHGELWTPVVLSDSIVVELTVDTKDVENVDLELGSINPGYRGFGAEDVSDLAGARSGSCNVDVVCPEGDDWPLEIASVAVISTGGSTFCTGFMVNNTAGDLTPFFMTANHCGINSGNAASLVAIWNYENSTCRPPGSGASGGPGDGTQTDFNTGSTFLASGSANDFTLVQLNSDPDPSWEVAFAGWDNSGVDATQAIAIHHPNTDEKRISFEFQPTTVTTYLQEPVPGDGTHVRIEDWDVGTTEPGSSGSPLFDQNHRVIGQLHGGFASCTSQTSDWYGRFAGSWTAGLSTHLDPGNTGATTVDTISGAGLTVSPSASVLHIGLPGGPFTDPTVVYTLSNPSPDPVSYSVSLTSSFGILLDGQTSPVTGVLSAGGGSTNVTVSLGAAINSLAAGVYIEDIIFEDVTNTRSTIVTHTVEVGQTLVSVTPNVDLETGGPLAGPFTGTIDYTVTSERPTPVDVEVTADAAWISLNGGTSPVTLNLSGTGDFDTLTVGISSAANSLSAGIYNGTVTFTNLAGGGGSTTRDVMLEVGRVVYSATDVPQSINDNSTITSTINVPDDFCIGDVNVDLDITHTYIGDLIVQLASPSGTIVRLHNRSGSGDDDIVTTYDEQGGTNPDGPGSLGDFNLTNGQGDWTLTVTDDAGGDVGTLNGWSLRIVPIAGSCPVPQVVHSYDLNSNPGWTMDSGWGFGQPTGSGGSSGSPDPTSGYTGTNVYGYNLNGDYTNDLSPIRYLTTTAIDMTNVTNSRVSFRRWLGIESASYDHANIQVSNNGTNWTTVWTHSGSSNNDGSWQLVNYDISAVADNEPTVYLRWGMGLTDGSVTYCGWNIDDIELQGVLPSSPGDFDNDGDVDGDDFFEFNKCFTGPENGPVGPECNIFKFDPDSDIDLVDFAGFVQVFTGP